MTYHSNPSTPSAYREHLGISPREFSVAVAVISHEACFGYGPTRVQLEAFLGIRNVPTSPLVVRRLLKVEGRPGLVCSTPKLRRDLGVELPAVRLEVA